MWFYHWLKNSKSSIDWKTHIQLYLENFYYWLENAIMSIQNLKSIQNIFFLDPGNSPKK